MEPRRSFLAWVVATVLVCAGLAAAQESDPIASDDVFDVGANKFLTRTAADARTIEDAFKDEDPVRSESCPVDLELSWMTEVSASVYATPIIADLYSDNHKDVVVPSFVHYLEVLEGFNDDFPGREGRVGDAYSEFKIDYVAVSPHCIAV